MKEPYNPIYQIDRFVEAVDYTGEEKKSYSTTQLETQSNIPVWKGGGGNITKKKKKLAKIHRERER